MRFLLPVLFFALPFFVSAQIVITEIMYNPEGADGGREWIEVKNIGENTVDLSAWRLFENESNHYIRIEANGNLTPGSYAIIADKPEIFLSDWPNFSGVVFDSAFSLKNTGETLILRDSELNDKYTVTYDVSWGASGDGNSLQLVGDEWISATPTIGAANSMREVNEPKEESSRYVKTENVYTPPEPKFFTARISKKEKLAITGAPVKFSGETLGTTEGLLGKTRFIWNFGDGTTKEGQTVKHTYKFPGEYIVILNAVSGTHATEDRVIIKAIPAEIVVSSIGNAKSFYIELQNNSPYELNLSGWLLRSGEKYFLIPRNTFILPNKKLIFSREATKLSFYGASVVSLLYPNGTTAHVFSGTLEVVAKAPVDLHKKKNINTVNTPTVSRTPYLQKTPPKFVENKIKENGIEKESIGDTLIAAPQAAQKNSSSLIFWIAGSIFFVLIGGAGVLLSRRDKKFADEFTILEEEDI